MVKKLTAATLMSVLLAGYAATSSYASTDTDTSTEENVQSPSNTYQLSSITWWWE